MATAGGGWQPAHVRAQLDAIATSDAFTRSERLTRFLSYVVEESLSGRADRLKGYTIGVEVFDKDPSFDPQLDSSVRVEAGRLRRMLQHYYLTDGQTDRLRIDIPKGTYAPQFETRALAENENAEQTRQSDGESVLAPPTGPSIAVLPFDNLTGDLEQDYFSDGMTEEIISQLARFTDLMVLARNTCFQYKGLSVDIQKLGEKLEVHYVLEGSVRRAGTRVRVTAQLLDATSATHVWSDSYDRDLTVEDLLDIQDDISQRVAATIAEPHGMIAGHDYAMMKRKPAEELDAYEAILQWHEFVRDLNPETHKRVRTLMERMVEKHPDYALAWVAMGELVLAEYSFGFNRRSDDASTLEKARRMVDKAIELDRNNPQAFHWLMWTCFEAGESAQAIDAGERALTLNPNDAYTLGDFGLMLWCCGQWDKGLALIEKGMLLNPLWPHYSQYILSMDAYRREEYEEAVRIAEGIQFSKFYWTQLLLTIVYAGAGMNEKARSAHARLRQLHPDCAATPERELRKRIKVDDLVQRMLVSFHTASPE